MSSSIYKLSLFLPIYLFPFSTLQAQTSNDSLHIQLTKWLQSFSVSNELPVARTFYFWKKTEELDSAIANEKILRSTWGEDCSYDLAWFNYLPALNTNKTKNHFLSAWLQEERFQNLQAAWPCYWVDIHQEIDSLPREYDCNADQLIKAELKDSSLIVVLRPDEKDFLYVIDLNGIKLTDDELKKRKKHIAAVYYAEHKKGKSRYCKGAVSDKNPCTARRKFWHGKTSHYDYWIRTFFLVNENMIRKWSSGTEEIKETMKSDLTNMNLLYGIMEKDPYAYYDMEKSITETWNKNTDSLSLQENKILILKDESDLTDTELKNNILILKFLLAVQKNVVQVFPYGDE